MAELVATIITIAGLAINSSKEVYNLIRTYQDAQKTRDHILAEISSVQNLLTTLAIALQNTKDTAISEKLRRCLQDFESAMQAFCVLCDEFKAKMQQLMQHSSDDKIDWRDKLRLHFEEKNVLAFKYRLASYKLTINITLGLVTLTTTTQDRQTTAALQRNITTALSKISGQIEGLQISIHSLPLSNSPSADLLLSALQKEEIALQQCLRLSTSAVAAAPQSARAAIQQMESFNQAQQFVVVKRGEAGLVGSMIARDSSQQVFLDAITDAGERELVGGFFRRPGGLEV